LTLDPNLAGRILANLDTSSAAIFADALRLAFDPDQPRVIAVDGPQGRVQRPAFHGGARPSHAGASPAVTERP
jgi:hypothetical protein